MTIFKAWRGGWPRLLLAAAVLSVVGITLRGADFGRALSSFASVGATGFLLALLPGLCAVLLEIASWQRALYAIGYRTTFGALFVIRVASESLSLCLPGGAVLAESLKLPLFSAHAGFKSARAVVAMMLRKYLVLAAQALYLLTATLLLCVSSAPRTVTQHAIWVASAGLVLGCAALSVRATLGGGRSARTVAGWLARLPIAKLRGGLARNQQAFGEGDRDLRAFFSLGLRAELPSFGLAFASWAFEAIETWVLLRLLGCELGLCEVAAMEATLSLLRSLLVFLPAGIGVQDAGYAFFLRALGVANASELGIAFALLKRTKELAWVLFGLALLAPRRSVPAEAQ